MNKVIHCKTCLKVLSEIDEPLFAMFDGEDIVTDNGCIGFCKDYDPDDYIVSKPDTKPLPKAFTKYMRQPHNLPSRAVKAERLPPRLKF